MTTPKQPRHPASEKQPSWQSRMLSAAAKLTIAALIILAAVLIFHHFMKTSPRAARKKPPRQARLVQVVTVQRMDCATTVAVNGTVVPAQQVTLQPQVAGQIVELSADVVPGGLVQAGQKLASIDPRDYDILVQQRDGDVARAARDLKVEQGNQAVAKQEYELLGEVIADEDRELVLREPQLASAEAALTSAQAALRKARLDLSRCDVNAPFNAIVRDKHVDLGATVGLSSQLVTLIGTDEAWINLKVPVDKLRWIVIPQGNGDPGSQVTISNKVWGDGQSRTGRVVRLYGEIETQGRMAILLVVVDDPFCKKPENAGKPKLLIGSYVTAQIEGRVLPSVFAIEETHHRDNDTVWILNDDNELEIRQVEVAFRGPEHVFVSQGLQENEQLVTTDIAAPVAGMPLRTAAMPTDGGEPTIEVADRGGRP